MAVTGTEEKVTGELRANYDTTMNSDAYAGAVGGATQTTQEHGWQLFDGHIGSWSEQVDAEMQGGPRGIKQEFGTKMVEAVERYTGASEGIMQRINQLETETTGIVNQGFKGTNVETAVHNLIVQLKQEATSYKDALLNGTNQIVEQVAAAYEKQDVAIGETMQQDTNRMTTAGN